MGADPSIDWSSVSSGYDQGVDASQQAVDAQKQNLQYWQNQDVLWASMYGNLEQNVANYYDNLTPQGVASEMNQQTSAQIQAAKERTLSQLQDRGFSNSGMVAQVLSNSNTSEAIMLANNAYNANKDVWQQKTAFMQGIALPQKQQAQAGITTAQGNLSQAYSGLSQAEFNRANARLQVEQFNESHSNDQLNAGLGLVGTLGGAYLGGGMGAAAAPRAYNYSPIGSTNTQFSFDAQPIQYDVVPTDTRIS